MAVASRIKKLIVKNVLKVNNITLIPKHTFESRTLTFDLKGFVVFSLLVVKVFPAKRFYCSTKLCMQKLLMHFLDSWLMNRNVQIIPLYFIL